MKSNACILGSGLLLASLLGTTAEAAPWMKIGEPTSIPYGHLVFCQAHPGECGRSALAGPAAMGRAHWDDVMRMNVAINNSLTPKSDMEIHGRQDVWTLADRYGDCEDYALNKRRALIKSGIAPSAALLTMVKLPSGEAHIVVTLRTDAGDFVLDSLKNEIKPWDATGYRFLKVQAPGNAGVWHRIAGGTDRPVS